MTTRYQHQHMKQACKAFSEALRCTWSFRQDRSMVNFGMSRLGKMLPLHRYFWPRETLKHLAELLGLAFSD
uniref:Uncharacterized protein n=1 Tax=Aegilops tauschii subsp. strangulata TaxID=200361 RepID=A0A452XXT1_AEGTS